MTKNKMSKTLSKIEGGSPRIKGDKMKLKNKLKTKLNALKKVFNEYIRYRDIIKTESGSLIYKCIACNQFKNLESSTDWRNYHASHYFLEDKYASVRFDETNVNGGCSACNRFLHGNLSEYEINLTKKVGIDRMEHLKLRRNMIKKFEILELEEMIELYKEKLAEQKKRLGL